MENNLFSYGRYNIYLAQCANLNVAVYWDVISAISNINSSYVIVDRKHIKAITGISVEEQRLIDQALATLKVLDIADKDEIKISEKLLVEILLSNLKDTEKKKIFKNALSAGKIALKEKSAAAKKAGMIAKWNSWITGSDALRQAYNAAFSVWYSFGWQTDAMIQSKIQAIESTTTDENLKISILQRAAQSGLKDLSTIIWRAKQEYNPLKDQRTATGFGAKF